jgi:hypothetical protein
LTVFDPPELPLEPLVLAGFPSSHLKMSKVKHNLVPSVSEDGKLPSFTNGVLLINLNLKYSSPIGIELFTGS